MIKFYKVCVLQVFHGTLLIFFSSKTSALTPTECQFLDHIKLSDTALNICIETL